jgi:hypothetical protein
VHVCFVTCKRPSSIPNQASQASIAVDARDGIMMVLARFFCRKSSRGSKRDPPVRLYECLLGIAEEPQSCLPGSVESATQAIKEVVERACVVKKGRRGKTLVAGPDDQLDRSLLSHLKALAQVSLLSVTIVKFI